MQQHLHTVAGQPGHNSTYKQWLVSPETTQPHLHAVAGQPRYNSTYPQWLVSPATTALTHSGWTTEMQTPHGYPSHGEMGPHGHPSHGERGIIAQRVKDWGMETTKDC